VCYQCILHLFIHDKDEKIGKEEHKKAFFGPPVNGKIYILALSSFW